MRREAVRWAAPGLVWQSLLKSPTDTMGVHRSLTALSQQQ
jgi:hypothetical protein